MGSEDAQGRSVAFDVSGYVRRARRLGDLSQRELAAGAGVQQAVVSRIEGGSDVTVSTFVRLLSAGGLRLAVVDENGDDVAPMPAGVFLDRAGRRRPAHLDVHAVPEKPTFSMLLHDADPVPKSGVWHHNRAERDRLRGLEGRDAAGEQLTAPVARERQEEQRSRQAERARQAGRARRDGPARRGAAGAARAIVRPSDDRVTT